MNSIDDEFDDWTNDNGALRCYGCARNIEQWEEPGCKKVMGYGDLWAWRCPSCLHEDRLMDYYFKRNDGKRYEDTISIGIN